MNVCMYLSHSLICMLEVVVVVAKHQHKSQHHKNEAIENRKEING